MSLLVKCLIVLVAIPVGLAIYTAVASWQVERAYPPTGRFVEVQSLRLHYVDVGAGPTVVLLHGASASLRDFSASIIDELAVNHRVIAFDRPGYGYSDRPGDGWPDPARQAELVRAALQKIDAGKPYLVGHSWAGAVVLAYLLDHPDDARGGILLAGAVNSWKGGVSWAVSAAGLPVVGDVFSATLVFPLGQLLLDTVIGSVFHPETPPPGYKQRTGAVLALRPGAFLASAEDVRMLSPYLETQAQRYDAITHPLLLVTGEKDTIVPAWNHADRLIKRLPHARIAELKGAGHALHHSQQSEVVRLIADFVAGQPGMAEQVATPGTPQASKPDD